MAKHEMAQKVKEDADSSSFPEIHELTSEETEERDRLLSEGFHDWTKRDFNNYIKACEKWGRNNAGEVCKEVEGKTEEQVMEYHKTFWNRYHELEEKDKFIKRIEEGEAKINRREEVGRLLKEKVSKYSDPWHQLTISSEGKSYPLSTMKEPDLSH